MVWGFTISVLRPASVLSNPSTQPRQPRHPSYLGIITWWSGTKFEWDESQTGRPIPATINSTIQLWNYDIRLGGSEKEDNNHGGEIVATLRHP